MALDFQTLKNKTILKSDYLGEEIYNLLDKTFIIPNQYSYNIFIVTEDYIARPDLISYKAYNDINYADILCKLNGISNPFELNVGMKLIIPSPEDIINFNIETRTDDMETGINTNNPKPKSKNEKRKTNEVIIGDTRFNIDKNTGVVIY